jgi:hypothetical protein
VIPVRLPRLARVAAVDVVEGAASLAVAGLAVAASAVVVDAAR